MKRNTQIIANWVLKVKIKMSQCCIILNNMLKILPVMMVTWILWMSPKQSLGDILCLLRFLLFFFFFLSSAKSLSDTFLGDYWTEINETSQEWRMLRTMSRCADYFQNFQNGHCCHGNGQNSNNLQNGFFSILAVSMATAAILKIPKVVCTSTHGA
jgi:hypothetical protein